MASEGFCLFGSHGHDHRILTRLGDRELACSLARSREILAGLTGQPVLQLAYPNGDHDDRVMEAAARAGYQRAYGTRAGLVAGPVAALSLPRISIGAFDAPDMVRYKIHHRILASWRGRRNQELEFLTTAIQDNSSDY
jgi:peptidoglycan/xylan/chitin deacetylase (PgdA/CDA1 family)